MGRPFDRVRNVTGGKTLNEHIFSWASRIPDIVGAHSKVPEMTAAAETRSGLTGGDRIAASAHRLQLRGKSWHGRDGIGATTTASTQSSLTGTAQMEQRDFLVSRVQLCR